MPTSSDHTILKGLRSAAPGQHLRDGGGNIDLFAQPRVRNPDGSISTVDSSSYGLDGQEVLLPSVTPDGRHLQTADDIIREYQRTGRHLGKFKTIPEANAYAQRLHEAYEAGAYDLPKGANFLVNSRGRSKTPSTYLRDAILALGIGR